MKKIIILFYLFILTLAVTGCSLIEEAQTPAQDPDEESNEEPQYNLDDLQGKWYRAYSSNPSADGMEVTVTGNEGMVTDSARTSFPLNSIKWKDIIAIDVNQYQHRELGSDSNYYGAHMELGQDDTLRIHVGHGGAGSAQKWVRTYTEPESEIDDPTEGDA